MDLHKLNYNKQMRLMNEQLYEALNLNETKANQTEKNPTVIDTKTVENH